MTACAHRPRRRRTRASTSSSSTISGLIGAVHAVRHLLGSEERPGARRSVGFPHNVGTVLVLVLVVVFDLERGERRLLDDVTEEGSGHSPFKTLDRRLRFR